MQKINEAVVAVESEETPVSVLDARVSKFYDFVQSKTGTRHSHVFKIDEEEDSYLTDRTGVFQHKVRKVEEKKAVESTEAPRPMLNRNPRYNYARVNRRVRIQSLDVRPEWVPQTEISFQAVRKATHTLPDMPKNATLADHFASTELHGTGDLGKYEDDMDKVGTGRRKPVYIAGGEAAPTRHSQAISEDAFVQTVRGDEGRATLIGTASAVSHLMVAARTFDAWDMVVRKKGGVIMLDKREGNGLADLVVLDESCTEPLDDPMAVYTEATEATHRARAALTTGEGRQAWREYTLDEGRVVKVLTELDATTELKTKVTDRTEDDFGQVHATVRTETEDVPCNVHTVIETGHRGSWASRFPKGERTTIYGAAITHNSALMPRWAIEGLMAGAKVVKVAFMARANITDASKGHNLMAVQSTPIDQFGESVALDPETAWGSLVAVLDELEALEDGNYLLVHAANANNLQVFPSIDA